LNTKTGQSVMESRSGNPITGVPRVVAQTVTAHQLKEGAGFLVRRLVPTAGLEQVDPFLMLDEVGPIEYAPGAAIGAPDHPHRGFEDERCDTNRVQLCLH